MSKKEIFIIIIIAVFAFVKFMFFSPVVPSYKKVIGKEVSFTGIVQANPDVRFKNQNLIISPVGKDVSILVSTDRDSEISYGDKVEVKGVLEEPENFTTKTGKEFNYKRYLLNQDIFYVMKNASVKVFSSNNASKLKFYLYKVRLSFMKNINRVITYPESDLANGLVLGARGGFDADLKQEFINTGTIHIIALSGYNITIVAEGVMKVLILFLSQTVSIVFGIFIIILFIIMTGGTATAIRAGIMAVILLFARMTGRTYDAGRALLIAGILMIAYNPRTITDISFQLSFLATFGVLFITPLVIGWVRFLPMRFKFRELVATTMGATISVLPILIYQTGVVSIVSIPTNILILPLIPVTMLFIFITGVVGFVSPLLSLPFAYISHLLLSYILSVIHFANSLSFASFSIQSFPLTFTTIIYMFLIYWVFKKRK